MSTDPTDLIPDPTPTRAITPTSPNQPHHRERFNLFSILFVAFMVLVGAGIWVTQFTGGSHNNAQPTVVAFVLSKTTIKSGFVTVTPEPQIKIYVTGEVKNPGIYTMQKDDRINDALEAAGGTTAVSDISQLDLAQRVRDEMHINIPKFAALIVTVTVTNPTPANVIINNSSGTNVSSSSNSTNVSLPNNLVSPRPTTVSSGSSSKIGPTSGAKINVNTADVTELERLPGVGATLAQRLVDYRTQHGPFHSSDDLHHVQGFTNIVVEKLKDLVIF